MGHEIVLFLYVAQHYPPLLELTALPPLNDA